MLRILAHHILHDGHRHSLAVAQFAPDFSSVSIIPFQEETPNTVFVEGEIEIKFESGRFFAEKNGRKLVF